MPRVTITWNQCFQERVPAPGVTDGKILDTGLVGVVPGWGLHNEGPSGTLASHGTSSVGRATPLARRESDHSPDHWVDDSLGLEGRVDDGGGIAIRGRRAARPARRLPRHRRAQ